MNEVQYHVTKTQIGRLRSAIEQLDKSSDSSNQQIHPLLQKAQRDGLQSLLDELSEQVRKYEGQNRQL